VEGSVVTIFQYATQAGFQTDHRLEGQVVEEAQEFKSLEAALAWGRARAAHVVLVKTAGAESRRYSAGSRPPPGEPDLPSWPPPPAERRALAAARAALLAERHLAEEVLRRQQSAEAVEAVRRLEDVSLPAGVVYLWEDADHLAGRWDAGWPEHPAGWVEEHMSRRSIGEALAWARARAEIVLVGIGTRRYWYSAGARDPGGLVPWRTWPPGPYDPETLPGQDPRARLTPLPGHQGGPEVAYR